jgi:electron transfer flavoprotein beta subunit
MRILVCVKQVADPEGPVSATGGRIEYGDHPSWRMNRYDEYALEEALRIREASSGTFVDVVSVGPLRAEITIRRSLEMGAGRGIHILTGEEEVSDPARIARLIASHAEGEAYDLILCGVMSEDDMNGQTGPMIAARIGLPCATAVLVLKVDSTARKVSAEREIDALKREMVVLSLPAVITVQSGINKPRYPSLSHVLRARSQDLVLIREAEGLARDTILLGFSAPSSSRAGIIFEGTALEKAEKLVSYLHAQNIL